MEARAVAHARQRRALTRKVKPMNEYRVKVDNDLIATMLLDDDAAAAMPPHAEVEPVEPPEESTPATGATAGIPGEWTPAGSTPPADPASCDVTADPDTPWTTGQFVQTQLDGAAGRCTWTGDSWVGGVAP
jgi:hypothetical protein